MTTIGEALAQGVQMLVKAGRQNARLDAQVLLGHVLDVDRPILYAYPERPITCEQHERFLALLARAARDEPVAYLVGRKEFYGRDFFVDRRVLIPRPETEILVEHALRHITRCLDDGRPPVVADIGTGSGIIPITLAIQEPRLPYLYAVDISAGALAVARLNCELYHVEGRVRLLSGDLLAPLPEPVDILLANLPYIGVQEKEELSPSVQVYEPHLALFSGPDGLDLLRRFCQELKQSAKVHKGTIVLLEVGYQQSEPLTQILQTLFPGSPVAVLQDYAGWDRFLQIVL